MTEAPAPSIDEIIAEHRAGWLRDAADTVMRLDPRGFLHGRLHVFDFRDLPNAPREGFLGFTAAAELHVLARHLLGESDADATAVAVAVNVDRVARAALSGAGADPGDPIGTIRAATAAVAAHEYGHALDALATGRRLSEGTTLESIVASLTDGRVAAAHKTQHTPGWVRAYLHLLLRAGARSHYGAWLARFVADVAAVMPRPANAYFDALRPDILRHGITASLVDVLRSPAPVAFLDLFETSEEVSHAVA